MKHHLLFCAVVTTLLSPLTASADPILLDTVVASVDNEPITLREVEARLTPVRSITLEQAAHDVEVRTRLDDIIFEKLIEAEAKTKHFEVGDKEVAEYLSDVAQRNSIAPDQLEKALSQQSIKLEDYKKKVRLEILKSRLSAAFVRDRASVTDQDIDEYLKNNPSYNQSTAPKIKLSQILISFKDVDARSAHTKEQARTLIDQVKKQLDDGSDFESVARKYSEAPEAQEGGNLGVMGETDLSDAVSQVVLPLKPGEVSAVIETPAGFHLFKLVSRVTQPSEIDAAELEKHRAQAKTLLATQKTESKLDYYFNHDLPERHVVDKKI